MPAIAIDSTGLKRKLRRTVSAAQKAQRNAARDASRQTRTKAGRMATETLNIKRAELIRKSRRGKAPLDKPKPSQGGNAWDLRIHSAEIPAHRFTGWKYRNVIRGRGLTVHGGKGESRLLTFTKRRASAHFQTQTGLVVQFKKGENALVFNRAFQTPSVGFGRVFIQRKPGAKRYKTEAIRGPRIYTVLKKRLPELIHHGRAALKRRGEYWKTRLTRPLR